MIFLSSEALRGRVSTSNFSGRLASDNRKSRKNTCFSDSLTVKRVGKLQCKGLFTWRKEDPSTRKILESETNFRLIYMQKFRSELLLEIK